MDTRSTRGIRRDGARFVGTIALGLAAACSSSSSGGGAGANDSGASADATPFSPLADGGSPGTGIMATCGQLAPTGGTANKCAAGQTCCTTLSFAGGVSLTSTCVAKDQCKGGTSNECQTGADCTGGQACCGGTAGGADAGLAGLFSSALGTTCQASCEAGQRQQCASSLECPTGQTCQASALAAGVGGDAGFASDGGVDGGFGGIAIAMTCVAPVPDAGTPPEAGPSSTDHDSGADAATADQ